jgi:3'-phosphoadenosine 5'-phosphosulfate sulfotransferase (PAPS reductase)/FAD synthetase
VEVLLADDVLLCASSTARSTAQLHLVWKTCLRIELIFLDEMYHEFRNTHVQTAETWVLMVAEL